LRNQSGSKDYQSIAIKQWNSTIEVEGCFFLASLSSNQRIHFDRTVESTFQCFAKGLPATKAR